MSVVDNINAAVVDPVSERVDTVRTRVDTAVAAVPGNMAGVGVALFVVTLAVLFSGVRLTFPSETFRLWNNLVTLSVYGLIILGLNMQFGDTGIANFGPVLFFAVGAYATAIVTAVDPIYGTGLGMPWFVGLAVAVVMAMVVGGFIGLTTLRLRGDYLAMVTLASAEIFRAIVRSYDGTFGGNNGITSLPKPVQGAAVNADVRFMSLALLFLGVLLVAYEGFRRLAHSPYGRVLRSILADEDAARSVGKNTFRYKMQVFVYAAAIAGLGGGLWALFQGNAVPTMASIDITVLLWLGMMIGGPGNYRGVLGGLTFFLAFQLLFDQTKGDLAVSAVQFNALRPILFGLLFILVIRFRPAGIWGESERLEVFKE